MKPDVSIISPREEVKTEKRKKLAPWDLATLYLNQGGKCANKNCGTKIQKGFCADDHIIPLACGGTNAIENRQLLCPPCHAIKTDKKDKGDAAEIKRRKGEKGQLARRKSRGGSMIKGRGFDKRYTKKLSGKVIRREKE